MTTNPVFPRLVSSVLSYLAALAMVQAGCASDQGGPESTPTRSCGQGDSDSDAGGVDSKTGLALTKLEQDIYAEILAQTFGAPNYVILDRSASWGSGSPEEASERLQDLTRELGGLLGDTLAYFLLANLESRVIPPDLDLGAPYTVIDRATLSPLTQDWDPHTGYWAGFFERFPEAPGLLSIAHVGFDTTGTQALAFLRWQAGGLAMWCRFFLLERSGDTWRIVDDVITVVS
jgi:hypothetical protein